MVFFICNHCGDSLKKQAVEKHFFGKCRGRGVAVSCMDCLKDFQEEYAGHTKCVSEIEKYSGKDFVAKPNRNKGELKQSAWTETLRALLDLPNLKSDTLDLLKKMSDFENVPRKKPKFVNFMKSTFRKVPFPVIDTVWDLLEAHAKAELLKKQAAKALQQNGKASKPAGAEADGSKVQQVKTEDGESANGVAEITSAKSKKCKKSKNSEADETCKFEWSNEVKAILSETGDIKFKTLHKKMTKRFTKVMGREKNDEKIKSKLIRTISKIGGTISEETVSLKQ